MIGRILAVAAGLCLLAVTFSTAQAEPRLALVIGNSNYGPEIGKLGNPVNDAGIMAQALQQTGFKVTKVLDANQKNMKRAIRDFGDALTSAGPTATGLFFYAGHGVQVKGVNYLVPVGADISKEGDVDLEAVPADSILQQMEYAGSKVSIVVLDACRNNPLQRSMRSQTRGLAPMEAAQGSFVAYSTAPGKTAADGSGVNSPYTKALAKTIVQPGIGIEEAFRDVRAQVMAATNNEQVPWDSSSLTAPFYFKASSAQFTTATQPAPQPTAKPTSALTGASTGNAEMEITYWKSIENSKQASDYQAYLEQFPNGTFAGLARNRLASLGQGAPREQPAVPKVQEPAAAPVVTKPAPEPEPVVEPVSTDASTDEEASDGIERDSHGVDCRIMDATRSESDCKNTKKFGPANKPGGYSGGSKSSGSHGWN